jgi:hypothetical protein
MMSAVLVCSEDSKVSM